MEILVLNCGSSSVKYRLYEMAGERVLSGGSIERIGEGRPVLSHLWEGGHLEEEVPAKDHSVALNLIRNLVTDPQRGGIQDITDLRAVGHRVVHGGERFVRSTLVTVEVEQIIEELYSLAPLHNPPNLAGIRAARAAFRDADHVGVFDTAFHQTMPEEAYLYPIPYELYHRDRIRKYGFHGTSHRYLARRASELLGRDPGLFKGITCHLGNGCSLAAILGGRSVDTSMGLTPLEGVPMGTRSGDIDPAIVLWLAENKGLGLKEIHRMLNRSSGLLGLSGVSNDLREVEAAAAGGNGCAEVALAVFAYRVKKYIGAYLAVLGGSEAIVFSGGMGQNGPDLRCRIVRGLEGLGIVLDPERNRACVGREGEISADGSSIRILVIPANEELMIARDTLEIVTGTG